MKKFFATLKADLAKAEVWLKSAAAAAFAGGINAAADIYHQGRGFELSAVHFLELKTKFISGAGIGLILFWAKSPLGQNKQNDTTGNLSK